MKLNKFITLFILLLLAFAQLPAQYVKKITLEEAIQMGLQHSRYLQIDKAKVEEANAELLAAKNKCLPDFKFNTSYMRLTNAQIDMKSKPGNGGSSNNEQGPSVNQAMLGMANFSLPIYAGKRIKYGIASAKLLVQVAKLTAESDQNKIAYNIANAFTNLFKTAKTIDVLTENLAASQQRDKMFLRLEENGIMAKNDRLKAQLQTANIELQLLDANNNYATAMLSMNLLLGLPSLTTVQPDSSFIHLDLQNMPFSNFEAAAISNRKDLQSLKLQQKAAAYATRSAKAENIPVLALNGGYVAANVPHFISVYNAVNLGIGIQYNLANLWKKNAGLLQSRAKEKQLNAYNDELNDDIKLALHKNYQDAMYAAKKTLVYERALEQSTENLRITKSKYNNSLATITDLLEADAALLAAKINIINSRADASLAYYKLLESAGLLPLKKLNN